MILTIKSGLISAAVTTVALVAPLTGNTSDRGDSRIATVDAAAGQVTETRWVVDYRGKPPFKREKVEVLVDQSKALVAATDTQPRKIRRRGPPGKNRAISGPSYTLEPAGELVRFARFEEGGQKPKRRSRGAPGKSNPALRNW